MMDFVKKNLKALVAVFLGLFHFVLLAIPFIGVFAQGFGSKGVPGYLCLGEDMAELEAGGFMKVALILFLIAAIALLLAGVYLLVVSLLGDKSNLSSGLAGKLCTWVHMGYAGTSILTFLAVVIVSIANTKTTEALGISMKSGISIGFGSILGVLLAAGSFAGIWLMEKKGIMGDAGDGAMKTRFVCSQCGEVAKKGAAFCLKCGGKVEEVLPTKPVCSICGAPAKKGAAFCSLCGGKVEEVVPTRPVCEVCGAPGKNGAAFCSLCGGKIVQK